MNKNNTPPAGLRAIREHNAAARPNSELLDTLRAALPQFFDATGAFQSDRLAAELAANNIAEARDGYRLSFVGKDYARLQSGLASETLLAPDTAHNARPENANSGNIFITGDNLDALRHLVRAYEKQIKVIYIDPPYNTGKEFTYSDKFEFDDEKLQTLLGYGERDVERLKCLQGKSSHSAWLTFMYPRLKLAQKLLRDDGVIFVSIDDNEQANLKLLMDEIFGEVNFIANFIFEKKRKASNLDNEVRSVTEFVLPYRKNDPVPLTVREDKPEENKPYPFYNTGNKRGVLSFPANFVESGNMDDGIYEPQDYEDTKTKVVLLDKVEIQGGKIINSFRLEGEWRYSQKALDELVKANERIALKGDKFKPYFINNDMSRVKFMKTLLTKGNYDVGTNEDGEQEVSELIGCGVFSNPKPTALIKKLIEAVQDTNSLILDFFAGSGTTAHAVMQLNAEDGGNRKFILVQWPEPANGTSDTSEFSTIDQISRERIRRAAAKIRAENATTLPASADLGFRHYKLVSPPDNLLEKIDIFTPDEKLADDMVTPFANAELNANGLDVLLTTWLLDDGFTFATPIQKLSFGDYTAHLVSGKLYLIAQNWGATQTRDLLNRIGTNALDIKHIAAYAYSFSLESLRELENNIKNNLDGDHPVFIEHRY